MLFVHGALVRDGQWWWHRMVGPLTRRGLSTGAVVLPSCEETPGELGDMYADAATVCAAVAAAGGPVILCGHSYGGTVITEAGAGEGAPAGSTPGPVVIGWGRHDRVTFPSQAHKAASLFTDAQLHWFDHCGHFPHWDAPEATVQLILASTT